MLGVKCGVWSVQWVKCGAVQCRVWGVKCGV